MYVHADVCSRIVQLLVKHIKYLSADIISTKVTHGMFRVVKMPSPAHTFSTCTLYRQLESATQCECIDWDHTLSY